MRRPIRYFVCSKIITQVFFLKYHRNELPERGEARFFASFFKRGFPEAEKGIIFPTQ